MDQAAALQALLVCPECRASLRFDDDRIVCAAGHEVGRVAGGVVDLRSDRAGADRELVEFWSASEEYYEFAREVNSDYEDDDHAAHRALIETLERLGTSTVLDVGCGTGEIAAVLAERLPSARYVGVDVSTLAPRLAERLGRPGSFLAADAERLPFADESFDAVISLFALEHFSRPREVLAELVRVAAPGAVVGILSLALDRPLGIVPSIRYGLDGRQRRDPLNVAVYAFNRARFAARQLGKQLRMLLDRGYAPFELVARPLVLDVPYSSDLDAVHVVSARGVTRFVEQLGCEVLRTSLPDGLRGWLAPPVEFTLVVRKRGTR